MDFKDIFLKKVMFCDSEIMSVTEPSMYIFKMSFIFFCSFFFCSRSFRKEVGHISCLIC